MLRINNKLGNIFMIIKYVWWIMNQMRSKMNANYWTHILK